jgi:hypothetical protein
VRAPSIERDGWCLESGEERHAAAPETFWIPSFEARRGLYPGCGVKLIFHIQTPDGADVERMWVVVTQRLDDGERYLGLLDSTPCSDWGPGRLEPDFEVPFEPRHVINILDPCEATMAIAQRPPARRWS